MPHLSQKHGLAVRRANAELLHGLRHERSVGIAMRRVTAYGCL